MRTKKIVFAIVVTLSCEIGCAQQSPALTEDSVQLESASGPLSQKILNVMKAVPACSNYNWKSRGRAPAGYINGVALTFARSLCRLRKATAPTSIPNLLSSPQSGNDRTDALTHYQNVFARLNMNIDSAGSQALRSTYVLGLGLGMRESSGQYCEGWDVSAGANRPSVAGEAGLYQVSYDSISASSELSALYHEYQRSPERCQLQVFKVGVTCRPRSVLGSGTGAEFQTFVKACPAFVTEYAMSLLRVRRGDFGPINRREAEVLPQCDAAFKQIQSLVDSDTDSYCQELL